MEKFTLILAIFLSFSILSAQNVNNKGMIEYNQVLENDTITKNMIETKGTLYFDAEEQKSIYVWDKKNLKYKQEIQKMEDESLKTVQLNGSRGTDSIGRIVFKYYKDSAIKVREKLNQWYIIADTVVIEWSIKEETKILKGMKLQRAEGDFRGRHYIAWFNPQIPISDGPWKLRGLPGLILEAYDEKKHVRFELISVSLPAVYDNIIETPTKGENINFNQYFEKRMKAMVGAVDRINAKLSQFNNISVSNLTIMNNIIERSN